MRDTLVARRTLLALAAGAALAGWGTAAQPAQPTGKRQPRRPPAPLRVVALDPGHGGVDPGAISPHGLYEKNVTLATARELGTQLRPKVPIRWKGARWSNRPRLSEWPPVWPSALPHTTSRGPSIKPSSTAIASPASAPPRSRTVVKPRLSMKFITRAARNAASELGWALLAAT